MSMNDDLFIRSVKNKLGPGSTKLGATSEIYSPKNERVVFDQLNELHCRWVLGRNRSKQIEFCGQEVELGYKWCSHHKNRVYRPLIRS